MKTYFIQVHLQLDGNGTDWAFQVQAQDIYGVAGLIGAINAGIRMVGGEPKATLTDLSTSKRRGVDYVNLDVWAQ